VPSIEEFQSRSEGPTTLRAIGLRSTPNWVNRQRENNHQNWGPFCNLQFTYCRNLPFGGKATRDSRVRVPRKEYARSCHQRLFEENVGKTRKDVIYELKVKGSGVVFTHGEGINTPRVRHKRRQPLIKCANMTSIFMFPFTSLFLLYIFYLFARYVFIEWKVI